MNHAGGDVIGRERGMSERSQTQGHMRSDIMDHAGEAGSPPCVMWSTLPRSLLEISSDTTPLQKL